VTMSINGIRAGIFAVCSGLACCAAADQVQSPTAEGGVSQQQDSAVQTPAKVEVPMHMEEPMQGGMMKKGMMKYDVKQSAEKKDKKMKEMLEKEQESMPAMPAQTPGKQ
jgi:hypothetical protein